MEPWSWGSAVSWPRLKRLCKGGMQPYKAGTWSSACLPHAVAPGTSKREGSWAADLTQYEDCLLIQMSILLHVCLLFC